MAQRARETVARPVMGAEATTAKRDPLRWCGLSAGLRDGVSPALGAGLSI